MTVEAVQATTDFDLKWGDPTIALGFGILIRQRFALLVRADPVEGGLRLAI